jgi:hypothetical protein
MRKLVLVLLMWFVTACATPPANLIGKNFDADSAYCRQLWKSATVLVRYSPDIHASKARATNPNLNAFKSTNQIKLDGPRKAYDKDCESLSSYNLRKRRNSIW